MARRDEPETLIIVGSIAGDPTPPLVVGYLNEDDDGHVRNLVGKRVPEALALWGELRKESGSKVSARRQLFEPLPGCQECSGTGIRPAGEALDAVSDGALTFATRFERRYVPASLCACMRGESDSQQPKVTK